MAGTALTLAEAAEALGISVKAVRSRVERGTIPATLGPDGLRRVPTTLIDELKAQTQQATAPEGYPEAASASEGASAEVLNQLLERLTALESAVAENAKLLQLTQRVEDEKSQLELKVFELSACVNSLEQQLAAKSRWWKRSKKSTATSESLPAS